MKNSGLICVLFACIGFGSCKNDQSEKTTKTKKVEAAKSISVVCYQSIYEADTLDLKINTFEDGKITGDLEMAIADMPKKVGELAGEIHGDTIFVSYTFVQGGYTKKTYKNPLALLKRGDQLILGNGKLQTTLGATHFIKGEPIEFDRVKYKFNAVDCVEK